MTQHFSRVVTLGFWVTSIVFMLAAQAHAGVSDSPYLFGDWNSTRTDLEEKGVKFDFTYGSEVAHNTSGGIKQITRYTDQWKAGMNLDLQKLWGWTGGKFSMIYTQRDGRNLGADARIGNNMLIQELYGRGQTLHVTEFALTQRFFGDRLQWRIGRLTVGADFDSFSCDFQNLTFCGSAPGNLAGDYWINWPTSQWGTVLKLNTSNATYVQIGAYQVNPNYIDDGWARKNAWKLNNPGGTTGALIPLEFGWTPTTTNGLPGSYKLGGWYSDSHANDLYLSFDYQPMPLTGNTPLQRDSRYGGYLALQQQITGAAGGEGVTLFLNYTQTDPYTSATDRQIAIGTEYQGIFNRAHDFVGFAIGGTHNSSRLAAYQRLWNQRNPNDRRAVQDGYEYVTELFYNWAVLPSINLRPNLQYVVHPGGSSENSNAFVIGLKSSINF